MGTRKNHLGEAVLTSTHILCFLSRNMKNIRIFIWKTSSLWWWNFSIYLNRRVFVMTVSKLLPYKLDSFYKRKLVCRNAKRKSPNWVIFLVNNGGILPDVSSSLKTLTMASIKCGIILGILVLFLLTASPYTILITRLVKWRECMIYSEVIDSLYATSSNI